MAINIGIELTDKVETQKGTKEGREWSIRKQLGYVRIPGEKYPVKFYYQLPRSQAEPLKPGLYQLDESSVYVDRYGELSIFPRLVPVVAAVAK